MRQLPGHAVAERIVAAVVLNVCLVSIGCALGQAFPTPGRPVAPIVSPAYTSEDTRDQAGEAERVMNRLGIRPGLRVADIGAGRGYYTVRLARRLEPGATVYAEDVKAEHLAHVAERRATVEIVRIPEPAELAPDDQRFCEATEAWFRIGFVPKMSRVLLTVPEFGRPYGRSSRRAMADGALSRAHKELIATMVSAINACEY